VICKDGRTTVVTSLAPGEEDVELLVALSAGGFRADEVWWRTTEEWEASRGVHGGMRLKTMERPWGGWV
jgi:hypothetical protein